MIKAIVFDLGKVLVDFDHWIAVRKLAPFLDGIDLDKVYALFFDSDLTKDFEEGKVSAEEFFAQIKRHLRLDISYPKFVEIWNSIFFITPVNREVKDLAVSLSRRYKTAVLTNINILHYEYLKNNTDIFDKITLVVTSFQVGARKPSVCIYEETLRRLHCLPQELFYTDDRDDLVQAARGLGIQAEVFMNTEKLKRALIQQGVELKN